MRYATILLGIALLLALCLLPSKAHASATPPALHPVSQGQLVAPLVPSLRPLLAPGALAGAMGPGLRSMRPLGGHALHGWLARAWPTHIATVQLPGSPPSTLALWLTSGVNRFLNLFSPTPHGPLLVPASVSPSIAPAIRGPLRMPNGMMLLTVAPVAGTVSSEFGYRRDPINKRRKLHKGIDYRAPRGTPVRAAGPGVVKEARYMGGYGRTVILAHGNGVETRYAHLHRIQVKAGQFVPAGQRIGTVGSTGRSTGPHLHFEVRKNGEPLNPRLAMGMHKRGAVLARGPAAR